MKGEKMEKVKRICFVWLALLPLLALAQQEPTFEKLLVPDRKVFDFGTIQEKDGPVSHSFTLKNTSDKPIAISAARRPNSINAPSAPDSRVGWR